jgi:hypothetical protein
MRINYTRLPGRSLGVASRGSLWIAPDHVLLVHESLTGESYRRFFFRDIESIVIRATSRRRTLALVLLALAVLNLLPLLALVSSNAGTRWMAWMAAGSAFWLVLSLVNVLRGPTCETRIRTGVQEDVVPPLGRLRTGRRVAAMLRTRILDAQAAGEVESANR